MNTEDPHPLVGAMFELLPRPGEVFASAERTRWMRLAWAAFDVIYGVPGAPVDPPPPLEPAARVYERAEEIGQRIPIVNGRERVAAQGRSAFSAVPCIAPNKRHRWPARYGGDGWMLCLDGCGAARKMGSPNVHPSAGGRARPSVAEADAAPPADHEGTTSGEAIAVQAPVDAGETVSPSETPAHNGGVATIDDEEFPPDPLEGVFGDVAEEESDDVEEESDEESFEEAVERERRRVIDGRELARLARAEPPRVLRAVGDPCPRQSLEGDVCGAPLRLEIDFDASKSLVCMNGQRHLLPEDVAATAAAIEAEKAFGQGKQRIRAPRTHGNRL